MVHLVLASLLHSFVWKLENGIKAEDMDMSDKFGFTLPKALPLRAIPINATFGKVDKIREKENVWQGG